SSFARAAGESAKGGCRPRWPAQSRLPLQFILDRTGHMVPQSGFLAHNNYVYLPLVLLLQLMPFNAIEASANSCSSVDLRQPGKSMHQTPPFNQGNSDYCWAFAG